MWRPGCEGSAVMFSGSRGVQVQDDGKAGGNYCRSLFLSLLVAQQNHTVMEERGADGTRHLHSFRARSTAGCSDLTRRPEVKLLDSMGQTVNESWSVTITTKREKNGSMVFKCNEI